MADPVKLTQLTPIDVEKGYDQWGTGTYDAKGNLIKIDWYKIRQSNSDRYRETHGNFQQDAVYEVWIVVPGFPDVFKSTSTGAALAPNDANGFPTERQANYPYAQIGQLPTYYKVEPSGP